MTKSELITLLSDKFSQLVHKDAELSVKTIIVSLSNTLRKGGRVEIRGFGSFSLNHRPARLGRNPKTGEKVNVPEKFVPHFKPGKELKISLIMKLIVSIRKILIKAIKYGGSSIRDYRSADGTLGNFQSNFKVYGKDGQKVGKHSIIKIVQYGRSTYYIPKIQDNK